MRACMVLSLLTLLGLAGRCQPPDSLGLVLPSNLSTRYMRSGADDWFFAQHRDTNPLDTVRRTLQAWGLSTRQTLELTGADDGDEPWADPTSPWQTPALVYQVQLWDIRSAPEFDGSWTAMLSLAQVGEGQNRPRFDVTGFEDLGPSLGLNNVGLGYRFLLDAPSAAAEPGAMHARAAFEAVLSRTFTAPDTPILGRLAFFVKNQAQTDITGATPGRTLFKLGPGWQIDLGVRDRRNSGREDFLLLGVDLPMSSPRPYDALYHFSYHKGF